MLQREESVDEALADVCVALWFCFGVGSKQGWLDVPTVPPWMLVGFMALAVLVWIGAVAFGKEVVKATKERMESDGE